MKLFVPGRLLLLGDHSDWAGKFNRGIGSHCVIALLDKGIYAKIKKSNTFKISFKDKKLECELEQLNEVAKSDSFFRYAAGTAYQINNGKGIDIKITKMDLPIGKGLASSATACVLIAEAYNKLYNIFLTPSDIMRYAYLGETFAYSKCGRGDQVAAYRKKVTRLIFNNDTVKVAPIKLKGTFYFVIVDLQSSKSTNVICRDLQDNFLKQKSIQQFIEEDNTIFCNMAEEALAKGNPALLGECMNISFKYFDLKMAPYSPEQLKAPKLHSLAKDNFIRINSYGIKGIGAQGDGSAQILCKSKRTMKNIIKYIEDEYGLFGEEFILKQ